MSNRHVHDVHSTGIQKVAHPRYEFVEPVNGDKVLLKQIGRCAARRRFELGRVAAGLVVPPGHGFAREIERIDKVALK